LKHIEGKFKGVKDLNIYYQAWIPNTPKAVIQLVHGGFEHSGRYQNVVNELIPESFAIYANDHLGHGKSEGLRNYVDSFEPELSEDNEYIGRLRILEVLEPICEKKLMELCISIQRAVYGIRSQEETLFKLILGKNYQEYFDKIF